MATALFVMGDLVVCLKEMADGENHRIIVSDVTEPSRTVSIPVEGEEKAVNTFSTIIHSDRDDLPDEWDDILDELKESCPELATVLGTVPEEELEPA